MVDSNVLIDVLTDDPVWADWSAGRLAGLGNRHALVINPVIYGEVSVGFTRIEELDEALPRDFITREDLPWEAAFLAGKAFLSHRRARRGAARQPLPDFFIGAHAAIRGYALLTRDKKRFLGSFPGLTLILPEM